MGAIEGYLGIQGPGQGQAKKTYRPVLFRITLAFRHFRSRPN